MVVIGLSSAAPQRAARDDSTINAACKLHGYVSALRARLRSCPGGASWNPESSSSKAAADYRNSRFGQYHVRFSCMHSAHETKASASMATWIVISLSTYYHTRRSLGARRAHGRLWGRPAPSCCPRACEGPAHQITTFWLRCFASTQQLRRANRPPRLRALDGLGRRAARVVDCCRRQAQARRKR